MPSSSRTVCAIVLASSLLCLAQAQSVFTTGFEAADGYTSPGVEQLSDHAWASDAAWVVPPITDNFAYSGSRSAFCSPSHTQGEYAFHESAYIPQAGADIVVVSAWVDMQAAGGNPFMSTAVGIHMFAGSELAGMSINGNGMASCVTTSGGSGPFFHAFALDAWHLLQISADFSRQQASLFIDRDRIAV